MATAAILLFLMLGGGALFFYFVPRGDSVLVQGSGPGDGDDAPLPRYNFERDLPSKANVTGSAEYR